MSEGLALLSSILSPLYRRLLAREQFRWYTGKKDLGKTSIAAFLVHNSPSVIAYHFANDTDSSRMDTRRALLTLTYQVCGAGPRQS